MILLPFFLNFFNQLKVHSTDFKCNSFILCLPQANDVYFNPIKLQEGLDCTHEFYFLVLCFAMLIMKSQMDILKNVLVYFILSCMFGYSGWREYKRFGNMYKFRRETGVSYFVTTIYNITF